ncbi:MAG: UDP-N-acetylmuramoyl-tripeptide--D-alanyl-D-alanine ligase [Acidimicrobiia bacterium]|nr:UDP-N-acetylmuramoyl-tripeptide--D-alanyl-D-alanine ligase [Acidimicrobiia bacterium]
MRLTAAEIAAVAEGWLVGADATVDGATQDSRQVRPGQLFVPVVAERDGHDFIGDAFAAGAAATLTSRDEPVEGPAVRVDDTVVALQRVAAHARNRMGNASVIGITGSAGKTSTKDLLAAILARAGVTHASERSFNNELGVPLTLLNAPEAVAAVVVEMGMRGPGQITELCRIAAPSMAVVTTVGAAHTSELGSVEAVAEAKGEIVVGLPAEGWAVLNAEVPLVTAMADRTHAQVVTFGVEAGDVRAESVEVLDDLTSRFRLVSPWGSADVELGARGAHNVANACAAAAASLAAGAGMSAVVAGLADPSMSPWRMELCTAAAGATVLNDAYNANPLSVRSALDSLAAVPAERRVAVLGLMAELGEQSDQAHAEMADHAQELGIEVIAVDAPYGDVATVADADAALALLHQRRLVAPGVAILVKGSRVAGLETVAAALVDAR